MPPLGNRVTLGVKRWRVDWSGGGDPGGNRKYNMMGGMKGVMVMRSVCILDLL